MNAYSEGATSIEQALVVFSGGQDSTTCLFWALKHFSKVHAITFGYGQKHSAEIECARKQKEALAQQLIQRNRELYNELIDNCTKLRTLGYDAVTSYSISPLREIRDERPKSRCIGKVSDDTKEKSTKRDGGSSIKREGLNIDKETEDEINQLFSDFFASLFN